MTYAWSTTYAMPMLNAWILDFFESNLVKFINVDFGNDKEVLGRIGLIVGNPFDL